MSAQRAIRHHHDEWLNLLERAGPFLTVPVLMRTWPAGLDPVPREAMDSVRLAFQTWREDPAGGQRRWITFVLSEMLDWRDCLVQGPDVPAGLELAVPEHQAVIQADFAFRAPDGEIRLLGRVLSPGTRPTARMTGGWSASEADRLALLQRRHQVPLGLATDGRWWALVWTPPEGATSATTWDAGLWLEERDTLAAFRVLLERRRFLGVPGSETVPALLEAGLAQQEEITETLGRQVRQAVEMLVEAIGRAGRRGGPAEELLADVAPAEIYHGAVTVMMRLLFLLFAEERLLLPADDELYLHFYSAGQLVDALRSEANLAGEEALEHRTAAWQRLLALFRGIHRGIQHDQLRIRAYGGDVFDPDRHSWLEGRREAAEPESERVLPIDDRTVLHALEALQHVQVQGERRRLSFRTLDVEQIGYVYEGLLGYDAWHASEPVLGLQGRSGEEPEVPLSELEAIGQDPDRLAEITGLSEARVRRLLAADPELQQEQLLRVACSGDEDLIMRVRPFLGLLRPDLRGLPVVIPEGGLYVTVSPRRRLSGTHYTPRDLAERVVIGALEPLVYSPGPLDTDDKAQWRRRPSAELLGLKIADIAMGSGAFLVSACRYLAGDLIEAWTAEGDPRALQRQQAAEDGVPVDAESDPVVIDARRQVIEHCLYGGDINPMAVEMAKLSLWLVSLGRERPFSFLDDRLVCGDSLLGLTSMDQLRMLHLDPARARQRYGERGLDLWGEIRKTLDEVERLRQEIADRPLVDVRDAQVKERLLAEAQEKTRPLAVIADAMSGAAIAAAEVRQDPQGELLRVADRARVILREGDPGTRQALLAELADTAAYQLDTDRPEGAFERHPTHWPLVLPEVFEGPNAGFDAVIGNPPFLGGKKISGAFGVAYREYLVRHLAGDTRGNADLVAFFLLVSHELLNASAVAGLIATNTIGQGDTREVGLDRLVERGTTIRAAVKSARWPTRTVHLQYAVVWTSQRTLGDGAQRLSDGKAVTVITTALDGADVDIGRPYQLGLNMKLAFIGSYVLGMGFTMPPEEAHALIHQDPRNREVLFPYLTGDDLVSRPDMSPSRWVINFRDWPLGEASRYPDCIAIVERLVKPERDRLRGKNASANGYASRWWQFARRGEALYQLIEQKRVDRVLAIALQGKFVTPTIVRSDIIFAHVLGVFIFEDTGHLALLSSCMHYWWTVQYASRLGTTLRYTPTDVFETFPLVDPNVRLVALGADLEAVRRPFMSERNLGLTKLYNKLHDPDVREPGIARLREVHREIDQVTAGCYGWNDLMLNYGFHQTSEGVRLGVSESAQRELLRRLLQLNHDRHAAEAAQGLAPRRRGRNTSQTTLVEA